MRCHLTITAFSFIGGINRAEQISGQQSGLQQKARPCGSKRSGLASYPGGSIGVSNFSLPHRSLPHLQILTTGCYHANCQPKAGKPSQFGQTRAVLRRPSFMPCAKKRALAYQLHNLLTSPIPLSLSTSTTASHCPSCCLASYATAIISQPNSLARLPPVGYLATQCHFGNLLHSWLTGTVPNCRGRIGRGLSVSTTQASVVSPVIRHDN